MYGETSGPRDISVSFDCTWHIKGQLSTIGACFVIEPMSGLVIDYVVLSKYCSECQHIVRSWRERRRHCGWRSTETCVTATTLDQVDP